MTGGSALNRGGRLGVGLVLALALAACSSTTAPVVAPPSSAAPVPAGSNAAESTPAGFTTASLTAAAVTAVAAAAATVAGTARRPMLLAVGDLGDCGAGGDRGAATAALASTRSGPIALLGDIAYQDGTQDNYASCFWPAWLPLRDRVKAVIGNHDDRNRAVFFANWPAAGTSSKPWYSYRVGSWLVLVVESNCSAANCASGSAQTTWLKNRLAANTSRCTLLAMHHPRFSSDDEHGDSSSVDALWRIAYSGGIDLVLAGHAHSYERIGPVGISGQPDSTGPVLLIAGTGGTALRGFSVVTPASQVRINDTFGLAQLTLTPGVWRSDFLAAPSGAVRDSASGVCG